MLSESLLLSVAGGAAGLLAGYGAIRLIDTLAPADVHNLHEMRLDPLVLGFTFVLGCLASTGSQSRTDFIGELGRPLEILVNMANHVREQRGRPTVLDSLFEDRVLNSSGRRGTL